MDLADRIRRPFRLRASDLNIGLLLFIATSLAILIRVLWAGVITSGFQDDVHVAASLARRYLQRPPGTEVVDMYTQGFLHPLLYVPLLALLRFIGIPPPLQDGFAIAFVQSVAVGLIAMLAYAGSRALLNRGASVAVCFFCVGPPLLIRPVDLSITQLTPNGEILGSVLLLGMWTLLVHRPAGRRALSGVVALSVAAFHLKYQLVPQVWALILGGGLGRRRTFRLLAISFVACLVVDLLVYRMGGYGLFSRAGSLLGDYMGVVDIDASSREPSGFSLRAVAVWFIVKVFTFVRNAPDLLMGLLAKLRTLAFEAPQFLLAWLVWLVPLVRPQRYPPHSLHFFRASLLLSLATIAAILLPNKGMLNYYLLLIPTAVVVMATGLANVPGLVSSAASAKVPASWPARPFAMPWWAPLLALTPVLALLSVTGHRMTRELASGGSRIGSLLPAETRQEGLHVFGLNSHLLGVHDTHISDLNLGTLIVLSWVKNDTTAYIRALTTSQDRPRFVLDHVSSPRKGAGLAPANYPPLEELARRHGVNLLEVYRVRQTNELGILYERISDPQEKHQTRRE
ncbi:MULTISPECIES: hypothetical protein [unclassified Synechococcus]|uniref:hypothetical protein n=1 Tax=unclassified Synechococcus TaxID=2626047 RepID=UPI001C225E7E|nr:MULTISPECIES: hypothetical protein [unclassified Synechococcus]